MRAKGNEEERGEKRGGVWFGRKGERDGDGARVLGLGVVMVTKPGTTHCPLSPAPSPYSIHPIIETSFLTAQTSARLYPHNSADTLITSVISSHA